MRPALCSTVHLPENGYDGLSMPAIIIFLSTGLLFYWISRLRILWRRSEDEIEAILNSDLLRGRRILSGLWPVFITPIHS
jgi:hypothetical protein